VNRHFFLFLANTTPLKCAKEGLHAAALKRRGENVPSTLGHAIVSCDVLAVVYASTVMDESAP
jgi:hypothetical protein